MGCLEALLGRLGSFLGASWLVFGPPSDSLERMTPLGRADDPPGPRRGARLRPLLGPSWAVLRPSSAVRRSSAAVLGPTWEPLGSFWGRLGGLLRRLGKTETQKGRKAKKLEKANKKQRFWLIGALLKRPLGSFLLERPDGILGPLEQSWELLGSLFAPFQRSQRRSGGDAPPQATRIIPPGRG